MTVVFVFKDGKTRKVANIQDDFRTFANKNCAGKWSVFNDISINMDDVSYFYEYKEEIE